MRRTAKSPPDFDPRLVPIVEGEFQRPLVAVEELTAPALRQRFSQPPEWSPELRREPRFSDREPSHASVLIPIVLRDQPMVLLTERTAHLSSHSGQIAFPGGKADTDDADAVATALREAQEEVGLSPEMVEVLGCLPHYITGSGFIVTPVVALVQPAMHLTLSPHEVAHAFEVPLEFLMNPANHRRHRMEWEGVYREWYSMPYQAPEREWFIWGATAGMLRNLYQFLCA